MIDDLSLGPMQTPISLFKKKLNAVIFSGKFLNPGRKNLQLFVVKILQHFRTFNDSLLIKGSIFCNSFSLFLCAVKIFDNLLKKPIENNCFVLRSNPFACHKNY